MRSKFLLKNIIFFLFPLLIPLILLGTLAYFISENHVKEAISKNNSNMLRQIEQHIDIIFNEMDSLNLDYSTNSEIILTFKELLRSTNLNYNQSASLSFISSYLRTQAIARPYIHSIYIYYENDSRRILTSGNGLVQLDDFYDKDWFQNVHQETNHSDIWVENRQINEFSFAKPEEVVSLYRNVFWSNSPVPKGFITLNIYKSYFENMLSKLETYENQLIIILDDKNNLLFSNEDHTLDLDLELIGSQNGSPYYFNLNGESFLSTQLYAEKNGWKYASIVETDEIFKIPIMLKKLTLFSVVVSLLLGIGIIFYLTRSNMNHVTNIISIINSAKRGHIHFPKKISLKENEYSFIIEHIIKTYVDQSQLKMELTEKKYQLQSAELLALQSQMNPHFLSNTLTIIYWRALGLTGAPNSATKMLEFLSEILNYSLRISGKTVPLKEEIHHTNNYLEILNIRYKDSFEVHWDYDETVVNHQVLKLLLQPLVENSIHHKCDDKEKILIKIKIKQKEHFIEMAIIDNGEGMSKEKITNLYDGFLKEEYATKHIGVTNTYRRLQLTYEGNCSFKILSKPGWGTAVIITYPIVP